MKRNTSRQQNVRWLEKSQELHFSHLRAVAFYGVIFPLSLDEGIQCLSLDQLELQHSPQNLTRGVAPPRRTPPLVSNLRPALDVIKTQFQVKPGSALFHGNCQR